MLLRRKKVVAMMNWKQGMGNSARGVALILVMLALLVLSTLAAAMVYSARAETFASYNYRISMQAEYVARAGLQRALNFFESGANYVPLTPVSPGTGGTQNMAPTPDSLTTYFSITVSKPPVARNSVLINAALVGATGALATTVTDDGNGNLVSTTGPPLVSGSINYRTGYTQITFQLPPATGTQVTINYLTTTYYNLATYATNPVPLYYSNSSPVQCSSDCSNTGAVTLGTTRSNSTYPPVYSTKGVDVVGNWLTAMSNNQITDPSDPTGSSFGNFTVTAKLLDYHTVNDAFFGAAVTNCLSGDPLAGMGICRRTYEVWQITATGTWNNNITAGAQNPTVVMMSTIAPIYIPYFGNALFGLCSVSMGGTNTCTDSYNSSAGTYGSTAGSCVTSSTTTTTNATATGAGVGSNGGITLNGNVTIGGNITYANATGNPACDTGFNGSTTNVSGTVLPGPAVPTPTMPTMWNWGYAGTGTAPCPPVATGTPCPPYVYSSSSPPPPLLVQPASGGGGSTYNVENVFMTSVPPAAAPTGPGGSTCPPPPSGTTYTAYVQQYAAQYPTGSSGGAVSYSGYNCVGVTAAQVGSGTGNDPYRFGNVDGTVSGNPVINFIVPSNGLSSPTFIAANSIDTGMHSIINLSDQPPPTPTTAPNSNYIGPPGSQQGAVVFDVGNNVAIGGQGNLNYNPATPGTPSPDLLRMNILGPAGTSGSCTLDLTGQAQLGAIISVPNGNACLSGSGSGGVFFGAILANSLTDSGNYAVHYDLSARTQSGKLFPIQLVSVTRPKL